MRPGKEPSSPVMQKLWKFADAVLDRAGLVRKSQQWVQRLEIYQPGNGERSHIVIELNNGYRWSGYTETGLPIVMYPPNPTLKEPV